MQAYSCLRKDMDEIIVEIGHLIVKSSYGINLIILK